MSMTPKTNYSLDFGDTKRLEKMQGHPKSFLVFGKYSFWKSQDLTNRKLWGRHVPTILEVCNLGNVTFSDLGSGGVWGLTFTVHFDKGDPTRLL